MASSRQIVEYRYYDLPEDLPIRVFSGSEWTISDVLSKRLHFHNCLEIGFCHSHSGFMIIDGARVPFRAGDIFLIPRLVPHTTCSDEGDRSRWSYLFADAEGMTDRTDPRILPWTKVEREKGTRVRFLCECLLDECLKAPADTDLIRVYFSALRIEYARYAGRMEETEPQDDHFVIRPVLRYLDANYSADVNMDALAELCHLSPAHFRRSFLETMGTSPLRYLNQLRIRKACLMLSLSSESILNIASAVGIPSVSSFNRNFQKETGLSPREYRKRQGGGRKKESILRLSGWTRAESRPDQME